MDCNLKAVELVNVGFDLYFIEHKPLIDEALYYTLIFQIAACIKASTTNHLQIKKSVTQIFIRKYGFSAGIKLKSFYTIIVVIYN